MKKQTAVEWLHDTWGNYPDLWTWEKIQEWFEQAKAMEKEQSKQDYDSGLFDGTMDNVKDRLYKNAEQYYIETYGGDK
jgi:hypothetical protein